jgi:hypothetical protein
MAAMRVVVLHGHMVAVDQFRVSENLPPSHGKT